MPEDLKSVKEGNAYSNRWLIVGLFFLTVFLLTTGLVVSNVSQSSDARLALIINNMSIGSSLSSLMIFVTEFGREYFWIPVVALMLLFGRKDTKMLAIELTALFIVGIIAGEVMKHTMYRTRPF